MDGHATLAPLCNSFNPRSVLSIVMDFETLFETFCPGSSILKTCEK